MKANSISTAFDRFLFSSCDPMICVMMRVVSGCLLLIYTAIWMLDSSVWFTDLGVIRTATVQQLNPQHWSILFWLPSTPEVVQFCLSLMLFQAALLLLGCASRFQAACLFLWLVSFQNRNPYICDGEDTVIRWIMFFMIFMPLDYKWSLGNWLLRRGPADCGTANAWALRLVQFEIAAIYLSTAWSKVLGETWRDGSALYYVVRMEDLFGRGYVPSFLLETEWILRLSTWCVLIAEFTLPFALWIPRTRKLAIVVALMLHLAIEYTMNLFLFEWFMLLGLLAFTRREDFACQKFKLPWRSAHLFSS